ncbi:MAG: TonB-dependent receptor, partial [Alphaproteobacteria bacterium]
MNHRLAATLAVATVALHATAGHAQPDGYAPHPQDEDFDTLIITGTRIPTPASQEGRSVSIVTADDIELRQQRFLFDALTAVPGVQVTRSGSFGALASVSIRGLSSSQTLAVQDGIVLNNPATFDNSFNFANFDTSDIERIEVIRGAQSTLYGSDAIGGVINIVTKDGRDGLGGAGFLEGGSFGSFRGAASLYGGSDVLSGRATISGTTTSGFSSADAANGNTEDDGFDTIAVSAKGRYQLASRLQFEAVLRYQDSKNEFDSFTFQPVDGDEVGKTQELTVGGFATLQTFAGKLGHRASVSYTRVDQLNLSDGIASFDSLGTRIAYEYQATAKPVAGITLVAGAEYDVQESQTRVGFGGNQKIKTSSGYGLLQVQPHERVTLSAGVRYDTSGDFGSETTLSGAGAVKLPLVGFVLRGSYSEGFRAPTAGELGFNPNLFAEFGTGWDIGLSRALLNGRVHVSATYFSQHVRDLIAFDLPAFTFI